MASEFFPRRFLPFPWIPFSAIRQTWKYLFLDFVTISFCDGFCFKLTLTDPWVSIHIFSDLLNRLFGYWALIILSLRPTFLTLTHINTHIHTHSHLHTLTRSHTQSLSLTHSHSHTLTHTLSLTHAHSLKPQVEKRNK